jgi:nitric oxide reductase subunit C
MSGAFTKTMARNIFYGGSVFFVLLFLALMFDTFRAIPSRDNHQALENNPKIALGKKVWENNNCIGCHTLMGEGAYYAPELANVYDRFGKNTAAIKMFIASRPGVAQPGSHRRNMPKFNLSDEELEAVAQFLKYTSEINDANWPPNIQG